MFLPLFEALSKIFHCNLKLSFENLIYYIKSFFCFSILNVVFSYHIVAVGEIHHLRPLLVYQKRVPQVYQQLQLLLYFQERCLVWYQIKVTYPPLLQVLYSAQCPNQPYPVSQIPCYLYSLPFLSYFKVVFIIDQRLKLLC